MKSLKFLLRCIGALSPSGDSTWLEVIVGSYVVNIVFGVIGFAIDSLKR